MKTLNAWNRLDLWSVINSAIPVCLIFISLFGRCKAQESSLAIPIAVFVAGLSFLCCCFWILFVIICSAYQKSKNIPTVPPTTTTVNLQGQSNYPQSHASGPRGQQNRLQSYTSPSTRVLYSLPTTAVGYTGASQTVPQSSEPVSLPEATLHQGDDPPGYEEAVRMKTVSIEDLA